MRAHRCAVCLHSTGLSVYSVQDTFTQTRLASSLFLMLHTVLAGVH